MFTPEDTAHKVTAQPAAPADRVFTGHLVKLPVFQGPVDLLLYLIDRDEIDIFDIPIEHITNEYLRYLSQLEHLNIEVAGEFLVMAAQLMVIKSRLLLPRQEQTKEDEEEAGDPRAELVQRLLEYRRYKQVAEELRARAELQRFVFSRRELLDGDENGNSHDRPVLELSDVSAFDLWAAFQNVLGRVKDSPRGEVARPRFTVPQKMAAIAARLKWSEEDGLRFEDLFEEDVTRLELVVTFLALLELIRLRRLRVAQAQLFGEIRVYQYRAGAAESSASDQAKAAG